MIIQKVPFSFKKIKQNVIIVTRTALKAAAATTVTTTMADYSTVTLCFVADKD